MNRKPFLVVALVLLLTLISLGLGLYFGKLSNTFLKRDKQPSDTSYTGENIRLITDKDEIVGKDIYVISMNSALKLVDFFVVPESPELIEYVWEFNSKGKSVKFRIWSAPCVIRIQDPLQGIVFYAIPIEKLVKGEELIPNFVGLQNPLSQQELDIESEVCKKVWSELGSHSEDINKIRNLFESGDTSGFDVDSEGIIDLRNQLILSDIVGFM